MLHAFAAAYFTRHDIMMVPLHMRDCCCRYFRAAATPCHAMLLRRYAAARADSRDDAASFYFFSLIRDAMFTLRRRCLILFSLRCRYTIFDAYAPPFRHFFCYCRYDAYVLLRIITPWRHDAAAAIKIARRRRLRFR